MAYGGFKDLSRRTAADKILRDKAFNIAKDSKYHGYQRGLASMVHKFFDNNTSNTNKVTVINSVVVSENKELAKELHKPIARKLEKQNVYSSFIENVNSLKEFVFYCVLLIFLVNILGLFL